MLGRSDAPLTSGGIGTIQALAEILHTEGIGAIFSSPLGRTVASARIYAERLGPGVSVREAMAELSSGRWEGKSRDSVLKGRPRLRNTWLERPPEGESYADAEGRVSSFVQEIRSSGGRNTILVIGHAAVNRVFLKLMLNLETHVALTVRCPHDTVYILEGDDRVTHISSAEPRSKGLLFATE